jgi:hypothetical protein
MATYLPIFPTPDARYYLVAEVTSDMRMPICRVIRKRDSFIVYEDAYLEKAQEVLDELLRS